MKEDTDDEDEIFMEENRNRANRLTKRNVLRTKTEDEYERTLLASGISIDGMDKDEIQQLAQVLLLSKQDASETCEVDTADSKKIDSGEVDSDSTQAPVATSQDLFHPFSPASVESQVEDVTADNPLQGEQILSQSKDEEETQLMETDQPPVQAAELSSTRDNRSQEQNPPSPVMGWRRIKLSTKRIVNKEKEDIPTKKQDDEVQENRHPLTGFFVDMKLSTLDEITESSKVLFRKYRSAKSKMLSRFELFAMGVPWPEYTKVILKYFTDCQKTMLAAQRTLCWHSAWGEPVKVGRHHTNTIDIRRRGQPSVSMELSDEETDDVVSESLPNIQQTLAMEDPVIDTDSQWLNVTRTTAKRTPRIESSSDEEFEAIKSRRLKRRKLLAENAKKKPWFSKNIDDKQKPDSQKIDAFFREETEIVSNTPEDNVNLRMSEAVDQDLQNSQSSKSSSTVSASQGPILNEMGDIYSTQMIGKSASKTKMVLDSNKIISQGIDIEKNGGNKVKSFSHAVTSKTISELESRNVIQAMALESQGFDIEEMKRFSKKYTIKRKLSKDHADYVEGAMTKEASDDKPTRSPVFGRSTKIELNKMRKRSSSPKKYEDSSHIKKKDPVLKLRKTTLEFDCIKSGVRRNDSRLLEFEDEVSAGSEISECKSTLHDNVDAYASSNKSKQSRWELSDDDSSSVKMDDRSESQPSRHDAGAPGTSSRITRQMDEQGDHGIEVAKKKQHGVPQETLQTVPCPLCEKLFSAEQIETHASECVGPQEDDVSDDHPNTPDTSNQTCYVCDRVLAHALYKDHMTKCLSNARQRQARMEQGESTPSQEPMEKRNTRATLRRRPLHEELYTEPSHGNSAEVKGSPKNKDLDYSPVVVLGSSSDDSYSRSESSSSFDEDDISLKSVVQSKEGHGNKGEGGNSPIKTFKSITDLKDSLVDFKNQFARKSKKRKASATNKSKTKRKPRKRKRTKK